MSKETPPDWWWLLRGAVSAAPLLVFSLEFFVSFLEGRKSKHNGKGVAAGLAQSASATEQQHDIHAQPAPNQDHGGPQDLWRRSFVPHHYPTHQKNNKAPGSSHRSSSQRRQIPKNHNRVRPTPTAKQVLLGCKVWVGWLLQQNTYTKNTRMRIADHEQWKAWVESCSPFNHMPR